MSNSTERIIIIGSGPAALTAAIYASRANLHPLVIEGAHPGGQLIGTTAVENWPGNISIMGPQLMINMKEHAQHLGTRFLHSTVTEIKSDQHPFVVTTDKQEQLKAHALIIATGAQAKRLNIPGENTYWGKGVSTCAICDGLFFKDKRIIIVGGGDTAMEDASFMTKFSQDITIVHILDTLTASAAMQERVLHNKHIKIIYNSTVTEIIGNGTQVTQATIINQQTKQQSTIATDAVFIAIGYSPNSAIFKQNIKVDQWGYIVVTNNTHTSIEGIFAAGDVVDYHYRQAITAAGAGCMASLDAERWLRSKNLS